MSDVVILRPENREAWLQARAGGIGSSEVATILGVNPYETPYQLWRRKLGIDPPKKENTAMRAGHYLEDAVAKFFEYETGSYIIKRSAIDWIAYDSEKPYLRVSPDRTFWRKGEQKSEWNKSILECKTTIMPVSEEDIPMNWFCQLQYQLGVTRMEHGALAWLVGGREFGYKHYTLDKDFYAYMEEEVTRFWVDNIQGKQDPGDINVDDVLLRNPRHSEGKTIIADDEIAATLTELKELKSELEACDMRKKQLEDKLKLAMGDAESITGAVGGKRVVLATWKAAKDTAKFDKDKFANEHPDIYKQYTFKQPGSRRFLIK